MDSQNEKSESGSVQITNESESTESSSASYESLSTASTESTEKPLNVTLEERNASEETSRQQAKPVKTTTKKRTNKPDQIEPKQKTKQAYLRASPKGTLYGLSSIKRTGNVKVNQMADYTSVKSNFLLGPLVLKVEKQFGKGNKRELRLATATTQEMLGRITLRIVNGAATLHSIKVQQPKQVPKRMMYKIIK